MLPRWRVVYRIITLLGVCALFVIIFSTYIKNNNSSSQDKFITILPPVIDDLLNVSKLLNLSNFKYIIANNVCRTFDKDILGIIIVTSYVGHDELRASHRQAISQIKLGEMGFLRVFLLAAIPQSEKYIKQNQINDEQNKFGDLLQGNFVEAYRNLSYKHVMGLRWAAYDCNRAKFVIKIDDDIVFDVFQLRRYLDSLEAHQTEFSRSSALLAGYILDSKPPIRNVANKWFVSEAEFSGTLYPSYLSGWLYITNPPTAKRLVYEAQLSPMFWIDDTWVTGILRERAKIPMQRLNPWYSANAEYIDCCVRDLKKFNYECDYFVGPNGGDSKLLVEFVHNVEKCYFDECTRRSDDRSLNRTCVASAKHFISRHGEAVVKPIQLK